jgi:hypothetical protein
MFEKSQEEIKKIKMENMKIVQEKKEKDRIREKRWKEEDEKLLKSQKKEAPKEKKAKIKEKHKLFGIITDGFKKVFA